MNLAIFVGSDLAKMLYMSRVLACALLAGALFLPLTSHADENTERAVCVRSANLYLSADTNSQKLGTVERGREVAVLEHSGPQWLHVLASLGQDRDVSQNGSQSISEVEPDKSPDYAVVEG